MKNVIVKLDLFQMKITISEILLFFIGLIIGFTIALTATWWAWKYCWWC